MWSNARSEPLSVDPDLPLPIEVRRVRNARRLRLRIDDSRGILKLTCPWRTSRREALRWALEQRAWIGRQLAGLPPAEPFVSGASIPIEGEETVLQWDSNASRTPRLCDGALHCGGSAEGFERRIERHLRQRALETMSRDVEEFAACAGVQATAVSVGDPASRWGSCSSAGRIRLSWRLICAPPQVRRYVVAHEVAHLVHLNHGADFKLLEAQLFGSAVGEAKAMLRRVGPRLRRIGRRG